MRDKKRFGSYTNHHHDDRLAIWCASTLDFQQMLVNSRSDQFFIPPSVGHRGRIGVQLDVPADWDEIPELIEDACRLVPPKTLIARLDARRTGSG